MSHGFGLAATSLILGVFLATPAEAQGTEDATPIDQSTAAPQGAVDHGDVLVEAR